MPAAARRVVLWGAGVNTALGVLKVAVGTAAGSPSLVADGVHSVSDLASDAVTLAAVRVARLPPDENHLFGHGRLEAIGTLGVSSLLLAAAGGILVHSFQSVRALSLEAAAEAGQAAAEASGPVLAGALAVALASIAAKEGLFRWTAAVAREVSSSTLLANAWHHRSDAMSSVVAAAGVGGALAGLPLVDAAGGVLVAALIARQGGDMAVSALRELSDEAADPETTAAVEAALRSAAPREIQSVRRLRTRVLGHYVAAEAEIGVDPSMTLTAAAALAKAASAAVRRECPRVADLSVSVKPHEASPTHLDAARAARAAHEPPDDVPRRLPGAVEDDILARVVRAVPAVRRVTHMRLHFLPDGRHCAAEMEIELRDDAMSVREAALVAGAVRREAEAVLEVARADVHIEVDDSRAQA